MSPRPGVVATRRTALTGAFGGVVGGALVLAGCDGDDPSTTPSPAASTTSPTPDDPDQALVDDVVAELDELIAFTAAAAAAKPRNAPWPAAFEQLHRAHRDVLTDADPGADPDESEAPRVRGSAQDVARQLTRREREAQQRLAQWAVAAQSGALARLLASMSAAVAQQLAAPVKAAG